MMPSPLPPLWHNLVRPAVAVTVCDCGDCCGWVVTLTDPPRKRVTYIVKAAFGLN